MPGPRARQYRFQVKLNAEERFLLLSVARDLKMDQSDIFRGMIRLAAREVAKFDRPLSELRAILREEIKAK